MQALFFIGQRGYSISMAINTKKVAPSKSGKQERSQKSRAKILKAAKRAFAAYGFDGANIRDIASEVGVTHTLIRYHFGNKTDLWKAVVDDLHGRLQLATEADFENGIELSSREGIRIILKRYITYCAENPEEVRVMMNEAMVDSDRLDYLVETIRTEHAAAIPAIRTLMQNGTIPEAWLVSYFYSISTMCQVPFVLSAPIRRLYGVDICSPEAIDAHCDTVLAFVLGEEPVSKATWPKLPEWTQ